MRRSRETRADLDPHGGPRHRPRHVSTHASPSGVNSDAISARYEARGSPASAEMGQEELELDSSEAAAAAAAAAARQRFWIVWCKSTGSPL